MTTVQDAVDRDLVRSLTVIPPWSMALVLGCKPLENRRRRLAGPWRGRVLILSSAGAWDAQGALFIAAVTGAAPLTRAQCYPGHYLGTVDLVDVHLGDACCCGLWGEPGVWHHMTTRAARFTEPIAGTGHLGLRRVTDPALIHAACSARAASRPPTTPPQPAPAVPAPGLAVGAATESDAPSAPPRGCRPARHRPDDLF